MGADTIWGPLLKLEKHTTPNAITVRCSGRMIGDTCKQLEEMVQALLPNTKVLLLDLDQVNYIDSTALGTIVNLYMSAKEAGCQLKLIKLSPRAKELLKLTHLLDVFEHADGLLGKTSES